MKKCLPCTAALYVILAMLAPLVLFAQPKPTEILVERPWFGADQARKYVFEYPAADKTIETMYGTTGTPGEWAPETRTTTTVDEHGNKSEEIIETYVGDAWMPVGEILYENTYESGRLADVTFSPKAMAEVGMWMFKDVYVYEGGKLIRIAHQVFNGVDDYSDHERTVYHYNGDVIDYYTTAEQWDEDASEWQFNENSRKYIHQYSGGRLATEEKLTWDEDAGDWEKYELHEYTYNADGSISINLIKSWDEGSTSYDNMERWVYSYGTTFVSEGDRMLPCDFALSNYPNPFNPSTTISFQMPDGAVVSLDVFDMRGRTICSLISNEHRRAGAHFVQWDGTNDRGILMPSGTYMYRLSAPGMTISKRCVLIK